MAVDARAVPALVLAALVAAPTAANAQARRSGLGFEVFPYAGASHNEREARLPVSPLAGIRLSSHIWAPPEPLVRVATFLGAGAAVTLVNEAVRCAPDPCPGHTDLVMDYLLTLEGGLKTDLPGEPYVLGFVGRGYPGTDPSPNFDTPATNGGGLGMYGGGLGISPIIGRTALRIEVRYRRDRRYPAHVDESVDILLGLPGW